MTIVAQFDFEKVKAEAKAHLQAAKIATPEIFFEYQEVKLAEIALRRAEKRLELAKKAWEAL